MKYYLIEIAEGDSKIEGKAIYEYNTLNDAIAAFHKKLGVAMSSDLYTSELVMIINSNGGKYDKYTDKYVAEPLPIEESTED